jgi:hypothetical protein
MATFARKLHALLREVGRRMMAWVLHHMEPECPEEARRAWSLTAEPLVADGSIGPRTSDVET